MEERLTALAAGELAPAERADLLAALAATPALEQELRRSRHLVAVLRAAAAITIDPPADLADRIVRRVAARYAAQRITGLVVSVVGSYARAVVAYTGLR